MRAAALTISSSVARGTREDRSGDALARLAADAGVDLIFTTGGTGLTPVGKRADESG